MADQAWELLEKSVGKLVVMHRVFRTKDLIRSWISGSREENASNMSLKCWGAIMAHAETE